MNIAQTKQIRLVDYLNDMGFFPTKVRGISVWYKSPFREEHDASFKVNTHINMWYDFGIEHGGDLVELGKYLYDLEDVSTVLKKIAEKTNFFEYRPRVPVAKELCEKPIKIQSVVPLSHPVLISYIKSRGIEVSLAKSFCEEIHYNIGKKQANMRNFLYAVSFKNRQNNYEIRNEKIKCCFFKKDISFYTFEPDYKSYKPDVCVFEGFMDFLSYLTLMYNGNESLMCVDGVHDYIVLNTVGNLSKCVELLDHYKTIHCYLDNDSAGIEATRTIASMYEDKVIIDESVRYKEYKDVNDFICDKRKT